MLGTAAFGTISEGAISSAGAALGMSLISLYYETTHLSAHLPYRPKTRYGRYMRRLHLLHHFQNERYWFGVTHPLGDWIAGTWKHAADVEHSPTVRTLGGGEDSDAAQLGRATTMRASIPLSMRA